MAESQRMPPIQRLYEMALSGLSHQEMADAIKLETGYEASRGAIFAALSRAGRSNPKSHYTLVLPWRVKAHHLKEYAPRMLRLLGRRIGDIPLNEREEERLDHWLAMIWRENAVVAYDPNNLRQGFHYLERSDHDPKYAPVRIKPYCSE